MVELSSGIRDKMVSSSSLASISQRCVLIKSRPIIHRDLDLMELKVKAKFVTSSKVKKFQNLSCHILEKINENYDKK